MALTEYIAPLAPGRKSLTEQARQLGIEVPIGRRVSELAQLGFDVDSHWHPESVVQECEDSPTGLVVEGIGGLVWAWVLESSYPART